MKRAYRRYLEKGVPKATPETFTLMPWLNLSQLAPEDLRVIYAYLQKQPATYNRIARDSGTLTANARGR